MSVLNNIDDIAHQHNGYDNVIAIMLVYDM